MCSSALLISRKYKSTLNNDNQKVCWDPSRFPSDVMFKRPEGKHDTLSVAKIYTHLSQVRSPVWAEVALITVQQTFKHKQLMMDPLAGFLCCVNTEGTEAVSHVLPRVQCVQGSEPNSTDLVHVFKQRRRADQETTWRWVSALARPSLCLPRGSVIEARSGHRLPFSSYLNSSSPVTRLSSQIQEREVSQSFISAPLSDNWHYCWQPRPRHENRITAAAAGLRNSVAI